jgi:intracellular sulfur oxidation DsrE/DsrF family protein
MKTLNLWLSLALVSTALLASEKPDDSAALAGVERGKVVFDVNVKEPQKLNLYLPVIRETIGDLRRQGVEPDVILAFRGLSVRLISSNREAMELTEFDELDTIAAQLTELQKEGVRIEACSVATRLFGIDNGTLLEGIKPVGNTFVSLTGYHAQGYASIPIY